MRFDTEDIINALRPSPNGCKFKVLVDEHENFRFKFGCYLLVNLQTGANQYLQSLIENNFGTYKMKDWEKEFTLNQNVLVEHLEVVKVEILKAFANQCKHCDGNLIARHAKQEDGKGV